MKYLHKEEKLCCSCMEKHEVGIIEMAESGTYKGEMVEFTAVYEYCSITDSLVENEARMRSNSNNQREAYRAKMELQKNGREV